MSDFTFINLANKGKLINLDHVVAIDYQPETDEVQITLVTGERVYSCVGYSELLQTLGEVSDICRINLAPGEVRGLLNIPPIHTW